MSGDMVSSSDNSSTETPVDSNAAPFSSSVTIVVGLLTSLLALLTIVGNSFTLIVFALSRSLRKFGDFFIINLAIADLAVGVMSIPPYIPFLLTGTWHGGMAFCKFWLLWDYVTSASSSLCICLISIDRYLLVVHPLLYRRIQNKHLLVIMLAIPWGATLLLYIPSIYLYELSFGPKIQPGDCDLPFADNFPFVFFTFIVFFILPYTLVVITSVMICRSIQKRMSKVSNHLTPSPTLKSCVVVQGQVLSKKNAPRVEILTIQSSTQISQMTSKVSNVSQETLLTNNVVKVEGHTQMSLQTSKASNVYQETFVDDIDNPAEASTKLNLSKPQGSLTESTPDCRTSVKSVDPSFILHKFHERKDARVALSLFVLVMVFAVCWIPYQVLKLITLVCSDCVNEDLYMFSFWLLWMNSTVNPVLYPILHRRFREAAASVITGSCQCGSCRS